MKKVLLDFGTVHTRDEVFSYIAEQMDFPEYFGKNLDALYDELTSIGVPTVIGIFYPVADLMDLDIDFMVFLDSVSEVFTEAEEDNVNLGVIFGDITANPEYEDEFGDDLIDRYLNGETDLLDDAILNRELSDEEYDDMDEELQLPEDDAVLYLDLGNGQK